jgi:hypothetical protein
VSVSRPPTIVEGRNIHRLKTGVQVESVSTDRLSIGEIPALPL